MSPEFEGCWKELNARVSDNTPRNNEEERTTSQMAAQGTCVDDKPRSRLAHGTAVSQCASSWVTSCRYIASRYKRNAQHMKTLLTGRRYSVSSGLS